MTIECYIDKCPHHRGHSNPEDGPLCDRAKCVWTDQQILEKAWEKPEEGESASLSTQAATYKVVDMKALKEDSEYPEFTIEMLGEDRTDPNNIRQVMMKGRTVAPDLKHAFMGAMHVWDYDDPPTAIMIHPHTEGETDSKHPEVGEILDKIANLIKEKKDED